MGVKGERDELSFAPGGCLRPFGKGGDRRPGGVGGTAKGAADTDAAALQAQQVTLLASGVRLGRGRPKTSPPCSRSRWGPAAREWC
jgi:hypothetical protein